MKQILNFILLLFFLLTQFLILPITINAQAGWPDPDFGIVGVSPHFPSFSTYGANRILEGQDGNIFVSGITVHANLQNSQFTLYRFKETGPIDLDFGYGGQMILENYSYGYYILSDLEMLSNGNFLMCGADLDDSLVIVSVLPDGTVNEDFGDNGNAKPGLPTNIFAGAMEVDSLDRILVASNNQFDFGSTGYLRRLLADGSLDVDFGDQGQTTFQFDYINDWPIEIKSTIDENIYLAGLVLYDDGNELHSSIVTSKVFDNGDIDMNYGVDGNCFVYLDELQNIDDVFITDLGIFSDGSVVVSGYYHSISTLSADKGFLVKIDRYGELDLEFGNNGFFVFDNDEMDNGFLGLCIQEDDKIIAGGFSIENGSDYLLVRLNPDGTFDPEFGIEGVSKSYFSSEVSISIHDLQFDHANRIITCGYYLENGVGGIHVSRFDAGLSSGVDDFEIIPIKKLYPNPVVGNAFWMEAHFPQSFELISIELSSLDGQTKSILWEGPVSSGQNEFELKRPENIPNGMYFLSIDLGHGKKSQSILFGF